MEQTKPVAVGGDACTTQNQGVRHGGVIDHAGDFISSDLGQWAEGELAKHGGDFHAFAEQYEGQGLRATKLLGKTHYLVASTGSTAVGHSSIPCTNVNIDEARRSMNSSPRRKRPKEVQSLGAIGRLLSDTGAALPSVGYRLSPV